MNTGLLKKIEELTLYIIEQQKRFIKQDKRLKDQEYKFNKQMEMIDGMVKKTSVPAGRN